MKGERGNRQDAKDIRERYIVGYNLRFWRPAVKRVKDEK
jgi:hypothetical protein